MNIQWGAWRARLLTHSESLSILQIWTAEGLMAGLIVEHVWVCFLSNHCQIILPTSPSCFKLMSRRFSTSQCLAVPRSASQASSTAACPWYHAGASRSSPSKKCFPGGRRVAVKAEMVGGSSHESFLLSPHSVELSHNWIIKAGWLSYIKLLRSGLFLLFFEQGMDYGWLHWGCL
jgi:hypothetical protein